MRVRVRNNSAELIRSVYDPARKRCFDNIVGIIPVNTKWFWRPPHLDRALEAKLTSRELETKVKPWLEKRRAEILARAEKITVGLASYILANLVSGLEKHAISAPVAARIYSLLEEVKNALVAAGHPAPKKRRSAKKSASPTPPTP